MMDVLDTFDRKILNIVQRDGTATADAIAERIGLSTSAVQKRLKRMRTEKIISAEIAVVDPAAVGRPMTFIAAMEIERENYETIAKFREWAKSYDEIQQIYYVTGSVDLIAIVTARDVEAYDRLSARIMQSNPMIRRINTNVVLSSIKVGLFVPVEKDGDDEPPTV
ncbi:MAG: Lrp/AsnC family transcriptional regulator [Burkholderia sp.]|jgi:DNA-binding Lrp family transcriptional regulator|uniref:Lrp/AsnC family transcriptional regulator n=1 Tax=Burkholderia sp. TaxID=36773 RepID=UPI00282905B7|nr:Lrp/AsnC family transcriptional regulator [Burkholderia sp.]MDR0240419.1 Lrp/AsnC family transcriptional regulator [Burkholderia sp.]